MFRMVPLRVLQQPLDHGLAHIAPRAVLVPLPLQKELLRGAGVRELVLVLLLPLRLDLSRAPLRTRLRLCCLLSHELQGGAGDGPHTHEAHVFIEHDSVVRRLQHHVVVLVAELQLLEHEAQQLPTASQRAEQRNFGNPRPHDALVVWVARALLVLKLLRERAVVVPLVRALVVVGYPRLAHEAVPHEVVVPRCERRHRDEALQPPLPLRPHHKAEDRVVRVQPVGYVLQAQGLRLHAIRVVLLLDVAVLARLPVGRLVAEQQHLCQAAPPRLPGGRLQQKRALELLLA
mmetsp:Transcript_42870/g.104812  ORF Transcript_42870/g.104812 Transcript_42870/m.104812 type:complete len:289 (-) Transcript_42870:243-1109(-)